MTLPYHDRGLRLDDSSFLKSDFRKGLAKHVAMIQTDVCDHAKHRSDDVRAVETASESGLKHHHIHLHMSKPAQCKRCGYLKEGHVKMVEGLLPLIYKIPDIFLRDQRERSFASLRMTRNRVRMTRNRVRMTSDHPYSFTEVQDMRRSIQADLKSLRCKRRGQHIRHRPLAVRTRDMDYLIVSVRMPCQLVKELHVGDTGLIGTGTDLLERGESDKQLREHELIF